MRFMMIGGFLGAGKTTTIARLAAHYQSQGNQVGIVTNDQANDLVDTLSLRSQGFDVGEVAGACFCCNFNDLTATISQLSEHQRPDIVIAEPVGSCTDLVATVVQPMMHLHRGDFSMAPFGVILKPSHGRKILGGRHVGFSPKAAYIFLKQLEEADFAIINQIDQLGQEEIEELAQLVGRKFPETPLLKISAKTGKGFDELVEMLARDGNVGTNILDIDYDVYAAGEAELGWLNLAMKLRAESPVDLDAVTLAMVAAIHQQLPAGAEVAHLKVLSVWDGAHAVANLTASEAQPVLSLSADRNTTQADLVVNARVAMDPDHLAQIVQQAIEACRQQFQIDLAVVNLQHFRPGRPVPTHRYPLPKP